MKKTLKYKNRKRKTQKGGSLVRGLKPGSMSNSITLRRRPRVVNKSNPSNPNNPNKPVIRRSYKEQFNPLTATNAQLMNFVATSPYLKLSNTAAPNQYSLPTNFLNTPKILTIKNPTSGNLYSKAKNYGKQNYAEVSPHVEEYKPKSTLSKSNSGATRQRSNSLKKRIIEAAIAKTEVSEISKTAQTSVLSELEQKLQKYKKTNFSIFFYIF